ncbi:DNA polymerase delta small subunit [Candida viswanathii]|uniref:DNA-directed DNA polymerase n=1 Tax=Candida viswanathii TaxID=5486 RepID=A0A367YHS1_9ASCO|nr:DNA polymerase delta small subunit [Candida viswanathii]
MSYSDYINKSIDDVDDVARSEINIPEEFSKRNEFFLAPGSRKYSKQYFSMYQYRLRNLKNRVEAAAMEKWGNGTKQIDGQMIFKRNKILDITTGKLCWVVGTVFCEAKYKLNILNDVEKGTDDVMPLVPVSYTDSEDSQLVMLEDESGRAILQNKEYLKKNLLVTGCVVAVLGMEIQAGIFEIMDVAYPTCAPQKLLPSATSGKIALVSGLNIGEESHHDLRLELLKQYVIGELGNSDDKSSSSLISQLIVAGNSIMPIQNARAEMDLKNYITTNNYGSKNISKYNAESLKQLDGFLKEVIVSLPVAVMPGDHDPAEICLPQQPLHKMLFRTNKSLLGSDRLTRMTNPQWMEVNGVRILGTSGQNVDDIKRYIAEDTTVPSSSVEIMESNIKWQNFAPTAPDTLYCYPYDDYDPFILTDEVPHVYFVGNQERFETKKLEYDGRTVRLVSVPNFHESGEVILLDLKTLDTEVVKIEL